MGCFPAKSNSYTLGEALTRRIVQLPDTWAVLASNMVEFYMATVLAEMFPFLLRNFKFGLPTWFPVIYVARIFGGLILGVFSDQWSTKSMLLVNVFGLVLPMALIGALPTSCEPNKLNPVDENDHYVLSLFCSQKLAHVASVSFIVLCTCISFFAGGEIVSSFSLMFDAVFNNDVKTKAGAEAKAKAAAEGKSDICIAGSLFISAGAVGSMVAMLFCRLLQRYLSDESMITYGWRLPFMFVLVPGYILFRKRASILSCDPDEIRHTQTSHGSAIRQAAGYRPAGGRTLSMTVDARAVAALQLGTVPTKETRSQLGERDTLLPKQKRVTLGEASKARSKRSITQLAKFNDKGSAFGGLAATRRRSELLSNVLSNAVVAIAMSVASGVATHTSLLRYDYTFAETESHRSHPEAADRMGRTIMLALTAMLVAVLCPLVGFLGDVYSIYRMVLVGCGVGILTAILMYVVEWVGINVDSAFGWHEYVMILVSVMPLVFLGAVTPTVVVELFPKMIRCTMVGLCYNIGDVVGKLVRTYSFGMKEMYQYVVILCSIYLLCLIILSISFYLHLQGTLTLMRSGGRRT